ncbi:hypothetical protein C1645_873327 [Glomus cerebriforme]|uniref:Uncharacterized protein n=1 Tax=Glomus cerebriforme TaxID=658196 RepID=A0A397T9Y8_9GLOM|nr:hypothetical protein C1645_873327 [Glomus cerebriforme]
MGRKNGSLSSLVWNGKGKRFSVLSVRYWNQKWQVSQVLLAFKLVREIGEQFASVRAFGFRKWFLDFISDMDVSSQNFHLMHLLKESLEIWFASELGKLKHKFYSALETETEIFVSRNGNGNISFVCFWTWDTEIFVSGNGNRNISFFAPELGILKRMQPEIDLLEQERVELLFKNAKLEAEYTKLKVENDELLKPLIEEYAENEADIKLKTSLQYPILFERIEVAIHKLETRNAKIRHIQRNWNLRKIKNSRQAQHRFQNTSWYKDVKKLEDIVNRDRQKRCICQDNGIFLLEVWYDEKPEIAIPKRIQKIKEFIDQVLISYN